MVGQVVGSYRIVELLGEGGMGQVFSARHTVMGKEAAVKMLLPEHAQNKGVVTRFLNEARTAGLIKHAGLVDMFDFGESPDGSAYIIMELLKGESLAARIERDRAMRLDSIVAISRQIANAVQAVHQGGIFHRDLKPDNIFLVPDADMPHGLRVKILDFGIAKLTADAQSPAHAKTKTTAILGTPRYMSPEQCRGAGQVDHRSDIYSLGCIMFEMATGRVPFNAEGIGEIISAHLVDSAPSLKSVSAKAPASLEPVVARALAKRVEDRFQTMTELTAALDAAGGQSFTATATAPTLGGAIPPTLVPVSVSPPSTTTLGGSAGETIASQGPRTRSWLVPAGLAVALIGGVGVYLAEHKAASLATSPAAVPVPSVATPPVVVNPVTVKTVHLRLDSIPPAADVFDDGNKKLGRTPYDYPPFGADAGNLHFRLQLDGYNDANIQIARDHDSSERVVLVKRQEEPAKPALSNQAPSHHRKEHTTKSDAPRFFE